MSDLIIYRGIKVPIKECIDKGEYWFIPRRIVNKFNKNGYDLIPKTQCLLLVDYLKKLEHHRDTTVGLYSTDRPDLVEDKENVMFKIEFN